MGRCITVIKVIGASSLGIATGTLTYTSFKILPDLINNSAFTIDEFTSLVKKTIIQTRVLLLTFGSLATTALIVAFRSSSIKGKHPYLIYAAIGFPLSLVSYFYQSYKNEEELLKISLNSKITSLTKTSPKKNLSSSLDDSVYQDLGRTSSQEENDDDSVEEAVNSAIIKKKSNLDLEKLRLGYNVIAGFTGLAFAIATIGLLGDNY